MTDYPDSDGPLDAHQPPTVRCELCGAEPGAESDPGCDGWVVDLGNTDLSAAPICLACQRQGQPRPAAQGAEDSATSEPGTCHFCGSDLWPNHEGVPTPCWTPVGNADGTQIPACGSCASDVALIGFDFDEDDENAPHAFRHCGRCLVLIDTPDELESPERELLDAALILLEESTDDTYATLDAEDSSFCVPCSKALIAAAEDYARCGECEGVFTKDELGHPLDFFRDYHRVSEYIDETVSEVCSDCADHLLDDAKLLKELNDDARRSGWDVFNDDDPMGDDEPEDDDFD